MTQSFKCVLLANCFVVPVASQDEAALRRQLDAVLLTSSEMALGPDQWSSQFTDEFPAWDAIAVDDVGAGDVAQALDTQHEREQQQELVLK